MKEILIKIFLALLAVLPMARGPADTAASQLIYPTGLLFEALAALQAIVGVVKSITPPMVGDLLGPASPPPTTNFSKKTKNKNSPTF